MEEKKTVLLVHGLASSSLLLYPLARRLRKRGFEPQLWSYFSLRGSIEDHAARLTRFIEEHRLADCHLVAHSMGAIIGRRALLELSPPEINRFVMLAPPNQGSHVATRLSGPLGRVCPALVELSDKNDSYVKKLGVPNRTQIGIVAADGDLVVRKDSLSLGNEIDIVSFPGMHSQLPLRSDVANCVASFLQRGKFDVSSDAASIQ